MDQLHTETAQLHDRQETNSMLLMCPVHEQGFRAMGSKMFAEDVQELVTLGCGLVKVEKPLTIAV